MKPADLRNATWEEVCTHVTDDMRRVHEAWLAFGPGTTRAVAERAGISLLTFRPRTTDLYKLGLVELTDREGNQGIYAHRTAVEAIESGAWRTRADFSRPESEPSPQPSAFSVQPSALSAPLIHGFPTVEAAINSLPIADRAALGAKLMAKYGSLLKKHEAGRADQLTLLPT